MISMVDYASRMLSALEEFSIQGSRHGQVALHSLTLRRSLATSLWTQHDGVLNQIINVGQKTAAALKFHGISSFKDVLASTEKQIERAAQRASPFAATLRATVATILRNTYKLSATFECASGSRTPCNLVCKIEQQETGQENPGTLVSGTPPVTYTLLAYTDRPGGCLLSRKEISGKVVITVPTPPLFGKIVIKLIASIVGLDGKFAFVSSAT
jgi:hypothetical protein